MKSTQVAKISIYLTAFVLSNLIVLYFGAVGLIFTALFLIPFDFVMRCLFHETWKGFELIVKMMLLVIAAGVITYLINYQSKEIAIASIIGFTGAQITAGMFYQLALNKNFFVKVNGSDAVGIMFDSIAFQLFAFGVIDWKVFVSQFALKIVGGLFWYYVIFVKFKLQDKWLK